MASLRPYGKNHYYVYSHYYKGIPVYERTCGTFEGAMKRLLVLMNRGYKRGFITINEVPEKSWY